MFENEVTFRLADATIDLPTFDMGQSGDIYFEFKTTVKGATLIHSTGPIDEIKVSIVTGNSMEFMYNAGDGTKSISVQTSTNLDDNKWHTVLVERNRKAASIIVDGTSQNNMSENAGSARPFHLTSAFVVGATTNYRAGFVGCIRALLLNGQLQDLRKYARQGMYGIGEGCTGRCESNPCLNNGTCFERYDSYSCDCRWTAFKGPICADGEL